MDLKNKIMSLDLFKDSERLKKTAILVLLILIIGVAFAVRNGNAAERSIDGDSPGDVITEATDDADIQTSEPNQADGTNGKTANDSGSIFVDIGGAVKEPKLAELPPGSRVEDAIVAAGGLTDDADISCINRAEFLEDGVKIYIPEKIEGDSQGDGSGSEAGTGNDTGSGYVSGSTSLSGNGGSSGGSGKININAADSEQLQELNGVGPATAQKIIDYRTANGRFNSIEDIKNVSGIGDKTFEKLKDYITI